MPIDLRERIKDYHILTIVRNPYSWMYSVYKSFYAIHYPEIECNNLFAELYPEKSLADFMEFVMKFRTELGYMPGLSTQYSFIEKANPSKLNIVKFEKLDKGLRRVFASLGKKLVFVPHELNRGNKNREEIASVAKNNQFINFVDHHLAEDFAKFNYPKARFSIFSRVRLFK